MFFSTKIKILQADITEIEADIIVNSANKSLLGGAGVDGAIHSAAGNELLEECKNLNGCETGNVKYTKAYNLNAKWIFHAVGPIWHFGIDNETELLAQCYLKSLKLAVELKCKTIAFPSISTGVFKFPKRLAARIALSEINKFVIANNFLDEIIIVCYDTENYNLYQEIINENIEE